MEPNVCKVFVGNVPFQCSQEEFNECFEKMTGFIKAEIVYKMNMSTSRGFGFVTFNSQENAKKLIENNFVVLKDRTLRFTEYSTKNSAYLNVHSPIQTKPNIQPIAQQTVQQTIQPIAKHTELEYKNNEINTSKIKQKNYLVVKNLADNMTRDILYDLFKVYGQIGRHFIVTDHETGNSKSYAVIEIECDTAYELLLKQREIRLEDNRVLEISKWKSGKQQSYVKQEFKSQIKKRTFN